MQYERDIYANSPKNHTALVIIMVNTDFDVSRYTNDSQQLPTRSGGIVAAELPSKNRNNSHLEQENNAVQQWLQATH